MPASSKHSSTWRWRIAALVVAAGSASATTAAWAQEQVVVRIGSRLTITVSDIQQLMRQTPAYQLRYLGKDHDTIRRTFLAEVVRRELLAEAASDAELAEREDVRTRIVGALKDAMLDKLRAESKPEDVTDAEIAAFYAENQERYSARKRLKLARIMLDSETDAREVLGQLTSAPPADLAQRFRDLARERSVDKATNKRGGDLDMVEADGSTANKSIKADPALYSAALAVKDGELVPEPVKDGEDWSIVWRRGSYDTPMRALANETPVIRRDVAQRKFETRVKELTQSLRAEFMGDYKPELVDLLTVDTYGGVITQTRPDAIPRLKHPAAGPPAPVGPPGRAR